MKLASGLIYIGGFKEGSQHGEGRIVPPDDPENPIVAVWDMGEMLD